MILMHAGAIGATAAEALTHTPTTAARNGDTESDGDT
jgi:hypothetical protein